jgi:arylsulfatase A-like enzyme
VQFGKNRPYEESARVPLFVRGPEVAPGSETQKLTLNTDFAPTFAHLAGVEFPADGRSLRPLMGGADPSSWRSSVLLEKLEVQESGEEEKGKAKGKKDKGKKGKGKEKKGPGGQGGPGGSSDFQAVRTETHKYVEYNNGERELYDLDADPYELENIYESADPSLLGDLQTRLEELRTCSEAGCRQAEDAP